MPRILPSSLFAATYPTFPASPFHFPLTAFIGYNPLDMVNFRFTAVLALGALLLCAPAGEFAAIAQDDGERAQFKPPAWEDGTVYNFGIYDGQVGRIGTAAYKISLDAEMGLGNYTIKYNAKSADMAESSTCVADRNTLLPVRSTRKISRGNDDFYTSTTYGPGSIAIAFRKNKGEIAQESFPVGGGASLYDFEELQLLIPQIKWNGQKRVFFYVFITGRKAASWVTVEDLGNDIASYKERVWRCRKYLVKSDIGDQHFWVTTYGGRSRIAKYYSGTYYFIDLDLPSTGSQADLAGGSLGQAMKREGQA